MCTKSRIPVPWASLNACVRHWHLISISAETDTIFVLEFGLFLYSWEVNELPHRVDRLGFVTRNARTF
jgi:hypothetical protein